MGTGFRIGAVRGIEIVLDWSLLIVFFLVAISLGGGVFPSWHPDWSGGLSWMLGILAAALFIVSVLAHELSHALVGRVKGIDVRRITLFVFGGMAQLEHEPQHWRAEFWMALVGPVTSLCIGFACMSAGTALAVGVTLDPEDPVGSMQALGPAATLMLWLGPINIALAVFNLVPAFPLDGGRMLRAILWGLGRDVYRATRWASALGRGFGILLVASGVAMFLGISVPYFGSGALGGMWLALIGWFLHAAAVQSYRQLLAQRSLAGVPVARLMLADVATVEPELPVSALIDDYLIAHDQGSFPVVRDGRLAGLVGFEQVRKLPASERERRTVGEVMIPAGDLATVEPEAAAAEAFDTLSRRSLDPLPVVADGQVRGLLRREDIVRWLALRGDGQVLA